MLNWVSYWRQLGGNFLIITYADVDQTLLIQTETQRMAIQNANLCGKKCDMHTLLKYAAIASVYTQ